MKRLSIYFFWDKDGVVSDYVLYQLREMRKFVSESCLVVNGSLNEVGMAVVKEVVDTILVRDNVGMDAAAYQHAIRHYGYERLCEYDELILWNYTCYGPFGSFGDIFDKMDHVDCGFWGLGRWPTYAPHREYHHIPSYFCGYRKSLLKSSLFSEYWEKLGDTSTYDLSVRNHEQLQTPYYEEKGVKTAVWFEDTEKYEDAWHTNMMPLLCSDRMIIEDHFPLVKRRIFSPFSTGYSHYSPVVYNILNHIATFIPEYDISLIVKDLYRIGVVEPYNISKLRLLGLRIHAWLAFSGKKRKKRLKKYQWALQSCQVYRFLSKS